jgi:hypothetical protein
LLAGDGVDERFEEGGEPWRLDAPQFACQQVQNGIARGERGEA